MKPDPILLKAADILERGRWTQGNEYNQRTGAKCAIGAMMIAAGKDYRRPCQEWDTAAYQTAVRRTRKHLSEPMWLYNDTPGRTKKQVVAALRGAATCVL